MRKFLLIFFSVYFLLAIVGVTTWYFYPAFLKERISYASPLPNFLDATRNQQVRFLDLWQPILNATQASAAESYTAESILVYDLTTSKTLVEKNTSLRLPMASLTKVMTTIIALENKKDDDQYVVPKEAIVGEDSMGLEAGEVLSLDNLLHGIFLHSANDAAETIAWNYPGGRQAFIEAMNLKAASLGLTNTHFTNPTGLQGDGDQHTTTYDLLVIAKYLLQEDPAITNISSLVDFDIPQTKTHKEYALSNETNLVSSYPGVVGLKDGYTDEAGLCLLTLLDYKGQKIIGIILNSQNRRDEMKRLLDYALESEGIQPPNHD